MSNEKKECEEAVVAFVGSLSNKPELVDHKVIKEFVAFTEGCLNQVADTNGWRGRTSNKMATSEQFLKEFKECISCAKASFDANEILFDREGHGFPTHVEEPNNKNMPEFLNMVKQALRNISKETLGDVGAKAYINVKSVSR